MEKGEFNGKCNLTSCQTSQPATWYNHSTRLFYCKACAEKLNFINYKSALTLFGHPLCTEGLPNTKES